eukprot:6172449-Pleurochrysis_carterae.AAC.3
MLGRHRAKGCRVLRLRHVLVEAYAVRRSMGGRSQRPPTRAASGLLPGAHICCPEETDPYSSSTEHRKRNTTRPLGGYTSEESYKHLERAVILSE